MQKSDELKMTVGRALGRIPSGVFVLTTGSGPKAAAMLASWVQQASFAPPCVSVAVAKDRFLGPALRENRVFALSVVGEHDAHLMKKYARGLKPGEDAFAGIDTTLAPGGSVVLADALAYLECELLTVCDFGSDHDLFVARVTAGQLLKEGQAFSHQRGNGFHY